MAPQVLVPVLSGRDGAGEVFAADTFGDVFAAIPACLLGEDKSAFAGTNRTHQTHAATQPRDIQRAGVTSIPL